ncbi:MAG TPA: VWA domain-containing protein [Rhizomicrobium sp.]|jgi:VWFA-related protein|nr:VWA domain-containing protein [Bryobacteraceae bacterium]
MQKIVTGIMAFALAAALAQQQPKAQQSKQAAQPAAQTPAEAGDTTFSVASHLVIEDVTAKDKDGKSIEGLKAEDFTVTEDGKPQKIAFCQYQNLPDTPAAAPTTPLLRHDSEVAGVTANQIQPETPGDLRYKDRRLMAIYFDMSAMPQSDQLRALDAAQKFVKSQMAGPDLVAIMEYTGGAVKVKQDFTDDREKLLTVIGTIIAGEGQGFDEDAADASSADTGAAFGQDDGEFNIFNTDRQLAAIQTAVGMLKNLNEKKALVYFASGIRLNGVDNQAQLKAMTNAAIRANVSIWSIDARGLVAMPPMGDAAHGSPGGAAMYSGQAALASASNFSRSQDTLYAISADTGGKALLDFNDLGKGIQEAQKGLGSYYVIGYYTTNTTPDGKFRKVEVALKEIQGKLDYRHGYYADKVFGKFTTADKERQLEDALMLQDPITDLTISMEINYFQLNRAEYYVPLMIKIPGSELALARRRGAEHTIIEFIGEIKDDYGSTIQNIRDHIDMSLSNETAAELAKRPIQYDAGYTLLPGSYQIKILARDDETGRMGTYMHKFVVPNLLKEDKRIPISSVVLSSQRTDMHQALYTAGKDKDQLVNPLVQEGMKLVPSVTRVFSKSRDLYVYLQAYERTAANFEPLVAFVTFYRGQNKAFETTPLPVTESVNNSLKTVPLKFDLSLQQLPPGKYNCQVTVLDPASQKAAFWQAPILLVQ